MITEKKLGIWMDHASAHIMEFSDPIVTNLIQSASTHSEKEKSMQKGEKTMHYKGQRQEKAYYKKLEEIIKDYTEVLLFGPTEAKSELFNLLQADKHFDKIKIETMHADKMTVEQEHAMVRTHFQKR